MTVSPPRVRLRLRVRLRAGFSAGLSAGARLACALRGSPTVACGVGRDVQLFVEMRRAGVGLGWVGAGQAQRLVDHLPAGQLVPVDQGDRDTGLACAAGAPDAVHVGLLVLGDLVVDDVGDVVDVDAAGGDVGGDEHVDVAGAERLERLLAGGLSQVAVHRADLEAAFGQLVGDLLGGALGAGEDHRGAAALGLQYPADQFDLVQRVGAVDELLGGVVDGRRMRRLGPDVGGLVHERAGQRDDRVRHRRREQHGLPFVGDLLEDPLDVGQEAEVEHFVGLVEHQHRQPAELQMALLGEVEQPARACRRRRRHPSAAPRSAARRACRRRSTSRSACASPAVRYFAAVARSPETCRQSSRVGTTTSARGIPLSGRSASVVMRCSSGTPKARVLPMPVRA